MTRADGSVWSVRTQLITAAVVLRTTINHLHLNPEAGDGVVADLEAGVTLTDERSLGVVTQLTTSAVFELALVHVLTVGLVVGELVSVEAPAVCCAVAILTQLMTSAVVTITCAHREAGSCVVVQSVSRTTAAVEVSVMTRYTVVFTSAVVPRTTAVSYAVSAVGVEPVARRTRADE